MLIARICVHGSLGSLSAGGGDAVFTSLCSTLAIYDYSSFRFLRLRRFVCSFREGYYMLINRTSRLVFHGFSNVAFELTLARKRASFVKKQCCGFCALKAHKNHNTVLKRGGARGASKAAFEKLGLVFLCCLVLLTACGGGSGDR